MKAKDITKPAVTISKLDSFNKALTKMLTEHTNTLLVVDERGILCGEVSVTDLLDAVIPEFANGDEVMEHFANEENFKHAVLDAADKTVEDFMVQDYSSVQADDDLITIVSHAVSFQRARVAVVDKDGRPTGIISRQGLKQILGKFAKLT